MSKLSRHNFMIDLANVQDMAGPSRTITAKRIANHDDAQRKELEVLRDAFEAKKVTLKDLAGIAGIKQERDDALERVKELDRIDALLARRPALGGLTRTEQIQKMLDIVQKLDPNDNALKEPTDE